MIKSAIGGRCAAIYKFLPCVGLCGSDEDGCRRRLIPATKTFAGHRVCITGDSHRDLVELGM